MNDGEERDAKALRALAQPPASAELSLPHTRVVFSLFEGDVVNRFFGRLGIHGRRLIDLLLRSAILVAVTWGILAMLAGFVSKVAWGPAGDALFLDFAAYLQMVLGLPLFVIAERMIGEHTREAAGYFFTAGVVPPEDLPRVEALNRSTERLRRSIVPDLVCAGLGLILAVVTLLPKETSVCISWHTSPVGGPREPLRAACEATRAHSEEAREAAKRLRGPERELQSAAQELKAAARTLRGTDREATGPDAKNEPASPPAIASEPHPPAKKLNVAGWYAMLVALPIVNYWWLRWIWKIALWTRFLFSMSRVQLRLSPSHPDATGGIAFVSDVQTKFGLAIVAFGVSNIASTVGYEVSVEHAPWSLHTVWGPLVGFVIGAPLVFTLPLFAFTKQLYRVKKRARELLYEQIGSRARAFDDRWREAAPAGRMDADLVQMHQLRALYEHVEKMRIVPFDLRSLGELLAQTLGSLVPLLGYLNLPEPVLKVLEHGSQLLQKGG